MTQPRLNIAAGDEGAVLHLLPGSGAEGQVALSLAEVSALIAALGQARARIVQGLAPGARERGVDLAQAQPVVGPAWTVRPEAVTEGSMLAFAHPGYGTVAFVLAAGEVEKMVRALRSHLGMVHTGEVGEARN